jgi:phosphoribosylformimino-5-aminoimidazole carboxamide ribotide isomerase
MRVIFVLDIFNGMTVHAVRGEREKYAPIGGYSKLLCSSDPVQIVRHIRPRETYIADLNLIRGIGKDNLGRVRKISALSRTMLDCGARAMGDVERARKSANSVVLGTETASLDLVKSAAEVYDNITVSIDTKNGKTVTADKKLGYEPLKTLGKMNGFALRGVILLFMEKVGACSGVDAAFLEKAVKISKHKILVGGGIRSMEDVELLEKMGIDGVLVSTAVHDGAIPLGKLR